MNYVITYAERGGVMVMWMQYFMMWGGGIFETDKTYNVIYGPPFNVSKI